MRIMVTGSRRWVDNAAVRAALFPWFFLSQDITLIHGGAAGADTTAEKAAHDIVRLLNQPPYNGDIRLTVEKFRPQYRSGDAEWNRKAPLARNLNMLDTRPDLVVAFLLGQPKHGGTQHVIFHAQRRGIPVVIVNWPELEDGEDGQWTRTLVSSSATSSSSSSPPS